MGLHTVSFGHINDELIPTFSKGYNLKAYIYTFVAILFWSTVATAFKLTLSELSSIQLLIFASLSSLLALFAIIVYQGKLRSLSSTPRELSRSALLGLINPTFYYFILFLAYDLLPAQEAQPLNWTWPIVLSILSVPLLKQKLTYPQLIGIVVSFIGVLIITTKGNITSFQFTNVTGDLLALSSSILWALFWIFNLQDSRDPVIKLFYCFLFGNIYNLLIGAYFGELSLPEWKGLLGATYIGLFEMGITFVIWLKALTLAKNSASVSIVAYITPFLSLLLIHFILREDILISSIIGLVLIVIGIIFPWIRDKIKTVNPETI